MDKLELKHIVGYLPFGLKCYNNYDTRQEVSVIGFEKDSLLIVYNDNKFYSSFGAFKPILHPLSDLTKEIDVNGEKFVPIQEYYYLRFEEISTLKGGCNALKFIQARELELLYEMHFDIHGLIEKGLAIDINTLQNDN